MFIKRVILSLACSAIALTLLAQVHWVSTMNIKGNEKISTYVPQENSWYSEGFNYSLYVCYNKPKSGARELDISKSILNSNYISEYLEIISKIPTSKVVLSDPLVLTVISKIKGFESIPVPLWNITHAPEERFQDFGIRDFLTSKCEAVALVENSISFFVRKDLETVTLYFYKDMESFVSHNLGYSAYKLTDLGKRELAKWLYYIPVKDITNCVFDVVQDIKRNVDKFYKLDFESSVFDSYLKNL